MSIMCLCRYAFILFSIFLILLTRIQATITHAEESLADPAELNLNKIPFKIEANFSDVKKTTIPEVLKPDLMRNHIRRARYALAGIGMERTNLTWQLMNYNIPHKDEVRAIIQEATTYWSNHSVLTFTESPDAIYPDIRIRFVDPMYIQPNALAETYVSGHSLEGQIYVNDKINWSFLNKSDPNAYSLRLTIAHALGHALGLQSSTDPKSIMSTNYNKNFSFTDPMSDDDLVAINKIYGIQEKELPNICTAKYDAVSIINNDLVIFAGSYIYFTGSNELKLIRDVYKWLPQNLTKVDAYYHDSRGYEYFVIGESVHIFDSAKSGNFFINLNLIGVHSKYDHVDAVFKYNGKIFIASGEQYWNVNENCSSVMGTHNMSDFKDISLPITTAFESLNGTTYFVKGNRYWPLNTRQAMLPEEQHRTKDLVCSSQKSNSKQPKCCTIKPTDHEAAYDPKTLFQFYGRKEETVGLDICNRPPDTVSVVNDDLVIFVGEYMYSRVLNEFMLIRDAYKWLPENLTKVDAYYYDPKGYEYFFIGKKVYKFYQAELIALRSENLSSIGFGSTIGHIDAVFKYNGSILAVSNDKYWTFSDNLDMVQGPMNMSDFSIEYQITGAIEASNRLIYFVFKNSYNKFYVDVKQLGWESRSIEHLVCSLRKKNILNPKCCTRKYLVG